jgi:thioredoxin-dependent peroxiredoxin
VKSVLVAGLAALAIGTVAEAQDRPQPIGEPLAVGVAAPDFALRGATRNGVLADPVKLSDYRGQTVVLAFFYKARTKG